jgi:hypothetical protein
MIYFEIVLIYNILYINILRKINETNFIKIYN